MFLYTVSYFGIWLKKRIQYDHHKILVLSDVNLPFHLLTQVSTLGISCLNLDHQLVWQTTCKNALQPWGISTLTSSQLFDIKNSCKLIPINFEYNCTHQDISIQMKTPQLWGEAARSITTHHWIGCQSIKRSPPFPSYQFIRLPWDFFSVHISTPEWRWAL